MAGEPDIAWGECRHSMYTTPGSPESTSPSSNTSVSGGSSLSVTAASISDTVKTALWTASFLASTPNAGAGSTTTHTLSSELWGMTSAHGPRHVQVNEKRIAARLVPRSFGYLDHAHARQSMGAPFPNGGYGAAADAGVDHSRPFNLYSWLHYVTHRPDSDRLTRLGQLQVWPWQCGGLSSPPPESGRVPLPGHPHATGSGNPVRRRAPERCLFQDA